MKAKETQILEEYFKTSNEYYNSFTFKMLCEVFAKGLFDNPETPLKLFSKSTDLFIEKHETPLKAVQLFIDELDKEKLNIIQKVFVYEWEFKYLNESEFDVDLFPIKDLLESQLKKLKADNKTKKPLINDVRESLKEMVKIELDKLPDSLKELEPIQRLNIVCKLIPYVLPKVEAVHSEKGEPLISDSGWNM